MGRGCIALKCGRNSAIHAHFSNHAREGIEVHGEDSAGSAGHACTLLSVAELPIHAHFEPSCMITHGGRMAAEVVRMAQVTGACDHIKFQARRREHACEGRHGGCMGVHIEAHKTHQGYPETNRNDVGQESISCMLSQFH